MKVGEFPSCLSDGTPFVVETYVEPGSEEPRPLWMRFPTLREPGEGVPCVRIPNEFPDGVRITNYTAGLISILAWGAKHRLETQHTMPAIGAHAFLESLPAWEEAPPGSESDGDRIADAAKGDIVP